MKHIEISAQLAEKIHEQLVSATGGASGLRDAALLESALSPGWQTGGGSESSRSAEDQAARVCFSIIENHPFVDGNKRAGIHLLLLFSLWKRQKCAILRMNSSIWATAWRTALLTSVI